MANTEKKEYTFITQQIKKKPFYKKKWFRTGLSAVALAIIFGCVAGFVFAMVMPWAKQQFVVPKDPEKIVIVQQETEQPVESETQDTEEVTEQPETETERVMTGVEAHKEIYEDLKRLARKGERSLVTVTGESSDVDWFNETIVNKVRDTGIVIAKGSSDYFILTNRNVTENAEKITVTFRDGTMAEATLRRQDTQTSLAVLQLPFAGISQETRQSVTTAKLASYATVEHGEPVIALGRPLGYPNSMGVGMVTAVTNSSQAADSNYRVFSTDIAGNSESSGVLITLDGRVVGVIDQTFGQDETTINALAIMDITHLIDKLTNNEEISYMGICGREVTDSLAAGMNMPKGIFVQEIKTDSPAMYAGMQPNDVLIAIDTVKIQTMDEYARVLRRYKPGDVIDVELQRKAMDEYVDVTVSVTLGSR